MPHVWYMGNEELGRRAVLTFLIGGERSTSIDSSLLNTQ